MNDSKGFQVPAIIVIGSNKTYKKEYIPSLMSASVVKFV